MRPIAFPVPSVPACLFPCVPACLVLGAFVGLPAGGLSAQLVELRVQAEEGAEFVRTSHRVTEEIGPGSSSKSEIRSTVGIRVAELQTDGSGTLHFTVHSVDRGASGDADSPRADPPGATEAPEGEWLGATIEVPFRPDGVVDLTAWSAPDPDDEGAFLETIRITEIIGPFARATGLPLGLPPALRVGESHDPGPWGGQAGSPGAFVLEAVEERDGRRIARIRLGGSWSDSDGRAHGATGHLHIDLDAERMVEWTYTYQVNITNARGDRLLILGEERVVPRAP